MKDGVIMPKPIRVLHIFGRLDIGGAESRTMDIYREINRERIQFDFAIHTEDECFFTKEVKSLGGKIFSFPRFNGKNYWTYKKAWNSFFKEHSEYKIIHGHQTSTAFIYLKEAKKHDIPIRIAHSRNSNKDSVIKKYTCKLARLYATHLLAVSKVAGISEFGRKYFEEKKVKVIPNAIEARKYSFNQEIREKKRKELGIQKSFAVCNIGRFHPQKNHTFLLQVFRKIIEKNEKAILFLIGDGPLRSDIEQQILELGLKDSVIMMGIRSDVPDLLQAMDLLLFPSLYEGLPGVVLEAQAAGLPSIVSDRITDEVKITDLVEYVALDKSIEHWAEKALTFTKVLERQNMYNEIVKAGYDINSVVKWYEDLYLNNYCKTT